MNVGSLFSGVGGIEFGFERAGFKTVWLIEYEPYAAAVLKKQFPEATIYGDITQIDFNSVQPIDVLTGGFPCQDISNAGKRAGITGSRSSLWKYYAEAIRVLRPKYAVIENVSALTKRGLDVVLSDLASLGYDAEWHCLSASSVGAPHRRDRIFVIAYPSCGGHHREQRKESIGKERRVDELAYPDSARLQDAWAEQQTARFSGRCEKNQLAYSDSCGCFHGQAQEQPDKGREHAFGDSREGCAHVADASSEGLQGHCESKRIYSSHAEHGEQGWWTVEPDVGRVAYGIPSRVDRIKCLGNAVVPQVAQIIAETIKQITEE